MVIMQSCPLHPPQVQPPAGAALQQAKFPSTPESAAAARGYVREVIERQAPGITPSRMSDVQLVVSELVTNSVRYGTEPDDSLAVAVGAAPNRVRIEVHDPSRRRPYFKPESTERQRGRGLFIVDELATGWGIDDRPFGKIVWAVLAW